MKLPFKRTQGKRCIDINREYIGRIGRRGFEMQQLGFELLLNPSVLAADGLRLSGQVRRMYRLFTERQIVSNAELRKIGCQYGARLWELRRALVRVGLCIDLVNRSRNGVCFYRLRSLSESSFFAAHQETL